VEKKKEIQPMKKDRVSWGKVKKADPNLGGEIRDLGRTKQDPHWEQDTPLNYADSD
jgi:hypothetical protein